jgi:ribosomal protein S18 acetylase RimI-like enzyme
MEIRKYTKEDEEPLMRLIEAEGQEWECYSAVEFAEKYKRLLESSTTYVAYENGIICGYSRSIIDGDFYIYICDLLVTKRFRGHNIGRKLMECVCMDYPEHTVLVLSDIDEYYSKQGYRRVGSIFEISKNTTESGHIS